MSAYFGKNGKPEERVYKLHGKTKQSQRDECDINKLLERYQRDASLGHLEKYQGVYGNYANYDFENHVTKIAEMNTIFEQLPAEVKRDFGQSTNKFFEFVTNPENENRLTELLPQIANQGRYFQERQQQAPQVQQGTQDVAPEQPQAAERGTQEVAPEKTPTGSEG